MKRTICLCVIIGIAATAGLAETKPDRQKSGMYSPTGLLDSNGQDERPEGTETIDSVRFAYPVLLADEQLGDGDEAGNRNGNTKSGRKNEQDAGQGSVGSVVNPWLSVSGGGSFYGYLPVHCVCIDRAQWAVAGGVSAGLFQRFGIDVSYHYGGVLLGGLGYVQRHGIDAGAIIDLYRFPYGTGSHDGTGKAGETGAIDGTGKAKEMGTPDGTGSPDRTGSLDETPVADRTGRGKGPPDTVSAREGGGIRLDTIYVKAGVSIDWIDSFRDRPIVGVYARPGLSIRCGRVFFLVNEVHLSFFLGSSSHLLFGLKNGIRITIQ
jgi:hypothetical protein